VVEHGAAAVQGLAGLVRRRCKGAEAARRCPRRRLGLHHRKMELLAPISFNDCSSGVASEFAVNDDVRAQTSVGGHIFAPCVFDSHRDLVRTKPLSLLMALMRGSGADPAKLGARSVTSIGFHASARRQRRLSSWPACSQPLFDLRWQRARARTGCRLPSRSTAYNWEAMSSHELA
jgi:hypothetical protein